PGQDGMLPPSMVRRGVEVREASPGAFVLAAPRPTPRLARDAARLLPGWRIAWQVAAARS
ncbi:MAG: hypothetical protein ACJ8D5_04975, partial [Sphingomicrobium sp.]